jgi:hypothetical protein
MTEMGQVATRDGSGRAGPFRLTLAAALILTGCASTTHVTLTEPPPITATATASTIILPTASAAASWPAPNDRLSPGAVVACTLPRPASERDVPAKEKAQVAAAYRYTGPRGIAALEFDHRIPFALCGANSAANIWPEPYDGAPTSAFVHNRKDQLEAVIARMVRAGQLTLAQAQDVFRGDWRRAWCRYVHAAGVACW